MGLKITNLEEKVTTKEEAIAKLNERVSSLEGKVVYYKARKLDGFAVNV